MCSIIGVGERLHKVLGLIVLGTLDSGERSLPFGLLVTGCKGLFYVPMYSDYFASSCNVFGEKR